jgi:MFS family permease
MLPRVALLPFAGVVVDRAGARLAALGSDVVAGIAQLAIGLLLLPGHFAIAPVAAAAAVGGAASAFGVPATLPLVSGTVDPPGRRAANSLLGAAGSAASVAGPVIAGALIFTVGAGWAFIADAATFAVSAGTLAVIQVRYVPATWPLLVSSRKPMSIRPLRVVHVPPGAALVTGSSACTLPPQMIPWPPAINCQPCDASQVTLLSLLTVVPIAASSVLLVIRFPSGAEASSTRMAVEFQVKASCRPSDDQRRTLAAVNCEDPPAAEADSTASAPGAVADQVRSNFPVGIE